MVRNYEISSFLIKSKIINWMAILVFGFIPINHMIIRGIQILIFCLNFPILKKMISKRDYFEDISEPIFICSASRVLISFTSVIALIKYPTIALAILAISESVCLLWEGYIFKNNLFFAFSLMSALISLIMGIYIPKYISAFILIILIALYILNDRNLRRI